MLNYDNFKNRKKVINTQKKEFNSKLKKLNKEKLKLKLDQFAAQQKEIQSKMNKYVTGPSSYN